MEMEMTLPEIRLAVTKLKENNINNESTKKTISELNTAMHEQLGHQTPAEIQGIIDRLELSLLQEFVRVVFIDEDDGYEFHMLLGPNLIIFRNEFLQEDCISIEIHSDSVHLNNYYYESKIKTCPPIPHARFFKFLKKLGVFYNLDVTLYDASTKRFDHTPCIIDPIVFSLAGFPTFYERYGFVNEGYTEFMEKTKKMTFKQLALQAEIDYASAGHHLQLLYLNEHKKLSHIARTILNMCKKTSASRSRYFKSSRVRSGFTRKTSSYSFSMKSTHSAEWLADFITRCVETINDDEKFFVRNFTLHTKT
jgi:hypothetical protein